MIKVSKSSTDCGNSSFAGGAGALGVGVAAWLAVAAAATPEGVGGTPFVVAPAPALLGVIDPSSDDEAISSNREVAASSLRINRVSA